MICKCQYCDFVTGEKEPLENKAISHGLCAICQPLFEQRLRPEAIRERSLALREKSRAVLEAIDILMIYYSRFAGSVAPRDYGSTHCTRCPLCVATGKRRGELPTNLNYYPCPWVVLEGVTCVGANFDDHNAARRIERLNRWKNILMGGAGK